MQVFWKIGRAVVFAVLWVWAALKFAHDVFGVADMIQDPSHAVDLGSRALDWLFSTPGWVPGLIALVVTAIMFWPRAGIPVRTTANLGVLRRFRANLEPSDLIVTGIFIVLLGVAIVTLGWAWDQVRAAQRLVATVSPPAETPQPALRMTPPPPPLAAPGVKKQDGKEFTTRTPRELLALYEGRTPLQADSLMEPYKGLWIEVEGEVGTILGNSSGLVAVVFSGNEPIKNIIECRFSGQWITALSRYNKGEKISAHGKISSSQNGSQLYLEQCEIP
jgi:hypothetical protein